MRSMDQRDRDDYWLQKNAAKLGIETDEDSTEAFIERVAIKLEACASLDENQARRQAFRELFEE